MNPSRIFILRPVATTLLMVAILITGAIAYLQLPLSALPEVSYPTIEVETFYPGASPEVITSAITAPLEKQFGQMPGLSQMSSTSSAGASVINLQFTLALAIVSLVATHYLSLKSIGVKHYLKHFFSISPILLFIGLLEIMSELTKIISFSFRLFGNIFAGSVLLFVMGSLLGSIAIFPSIFYMLEFLVGAIQAIVFGLLTMTFMAQATQGHGEHGGCRSCLPRVARLISSCRHLRGDRSSRW